MPDHAGFCWRGCTAVWRLDLNAISPVTNVDLGPSRSSRVAQIAAAERVAEAAALQEPKPPEAVSVLRDLHMARFALLASHLEGGDHVSAAVAAYNRATRVLNAFAESPVALPPLRG